MRYRHRSQSTEKIIFWSWFMETVVELGHQSCTLLWPACHNVKKCQQLMAMEQESSFLQSHCTEQACWNWSVAWSGAIMTGKQKGEELPNTSSSHIILPCRKRWAARAKCERQNSSAKPSWSAHVLTGLLKIANRLQLFTPHRILGGSRDVSYGNHYRTNHWALSSLHKWTEHDWVSRGSPFNMCKECDPPASSPQNMPKVSPLRSEWSRFALCLPNNSFTKSLNIGKLK